MKSLISFGVWKKNVPLRTTIRGKGLFSYFTIYICTYIYHKNVKWLVFIKFRNMICPQETLCLTFILFSHKIAINVPNSNKEQFYVHNVSLSSSKNIWCMYMYDIVQKFWEGHKILKKSPTLHNYKNLIYTAFAAKFLKYIVWLTTTLTRHCAKNEGTYTMLQINRHNGMEFEPVSGLFSY